MSGYFTSAEKISISVVITTGMKGCSLEVGGTFTLAFALEVGGTTVSSAEKMSISVVITTGVKGCGLVLGATTTFALVVGGNTTLGLVVGGIFCGPGLTAPGSVAINADDAVINKAVITKTRAIKSGFIRKDRGARRVTNATDMLPGLRKGKNECITRILLQTFGRSRVVKITVSYGPEPVIAGSLTASPQTLSQT